VRGPAHRRRQYAAQGAPELDAQVRELLAGAEAVTQRPDRGLDHGAYVPLLVMYPEADVPVLQISMPSLDPERLLELGEMLRPVRRDGVLIIGSGFLTHGLPYLQDFRTDAPPPGWSQEFDGWAQAALDSRDIEALIRFRDVPAAWYAHPTTEHFAPLFVTLGAADPGAVMVTPITGYFLGLSKRSIQIA
jgi:4,5-DOPA dioxygenase extradiol